MNIRDIYDAVSRDELLLIDLSHSLSNGMPIYPGDPPFNHEYVRFGKSYGEATLSRVCMGMHTGTHIDLPLHFQPGGASVDKFPLSRFIVYSVALDLSGKAPGEPIGRVDLEAFRDRIRGGLGILLYTGFSSKWGSEEFLYNWQYLSRDGADYLVERGVSLVGTEALSVAGYSGKPDYPYPARVSRDDVVYVHYKLLSSNVLIIEGLTNLDRVLNECLNSEALLIVAPLNVIGSEAGQSRVFALCNPARR